MGRTDISTPPNIFSLEFHTKFFPQLLWSRLRPKKEQEGVRFCHTFEIMIAHAFCLMLIAIGIPMVLKHGSVIGWILGILGIVGTVALLIFSILSQVDTKPSFENFLIGLFFFFIFLGLTVGIFIGTSEHTTRIYVGTAEHSLPWMILSIILGLLGGYVLGLLAGLWFQYLGWIAEILDMMAGCAIIGIVVVDLVLLFAG